MVVPYIVYGTYNIMSELLDIEQLEKALKLLDAHLGMNNADPVCLVACGGAALIALDLISRTTEDLDVIALMDAAHELVCPEPLPDSVLKAAQEVADIMGLRRNWLNNGPCKDEGGLFQLGLPDGLRDRLTERKYGAHLTVLFIGRIDQIHFKLYAAVDRGGYHVDDLQKLEPTGDELEAAARWTMTHDVSEGFAMVLKDFIRRLGHESVAEKL